VNGNVAGAGRYFQVHVSGNLQSAFKVAGAGRMEWQGSQSSQHKDKGQSLE
jgi:hypothetical protein